MMRVITMCLLSLLVSLWQPAQAGKILNDALATRPFSHHVWQDVLTRHVNADGNVNFVRLRAQPKRLNQYLAQLEAVSPDSHPDYFPTPNDQLAYWINAHNALALRLILDAYPIDRVDQIPDWLNNNRYRLGGQPTSLARIRQHIRQRTHLHPSVIFSLSDYSQTAPPILPQAYEGDKLARQLQQARQQAIHQGGLVQFKRQESTGCVDVLASPYFQAFQSAAFNPDKGTEEDRDALSDDPIRSTPKTDWRDLFREFAPPDVYADLGKPCGQGVLFMPPAPELRQVKPW